MASKKLRTTFIVLVTIFAVILLVMLFQTDSYSSKTISNQNTLSALKSAYTKIPRKIVIGTTSCRNKSDADTDYNNFTITMLKSVLISAQRDHVPEVDIHLFVEHIDTDAEYIKRNVLTEHKYVGSVPITVNVYAHSAASIIPENYRAAMIYNEKRYRCGFVRMFYTVS